MSTGFVLYEGPSLLDGEQVVCVATDVSAKNDKTGDMIQTWFLRQDSPPHVAAREGNDVSVCGDCPIKRGCYVTLYQAPLQVWRTWRAGRYAPYDERVVADRTRGRLVRLGSYGDPACVPAQVLVQAIATSAGHTGYTHQWRRFPYLRQWLMASVDTARERDQARALGFRTFRVRPVGDESRDAGEAQCPASEEAGHKLTCAECLACCGRSRGLRGDVAITAHGSGKFNVHRGGMFV